MPELQEHEAASFMHFLRNEPPAFDLSIVPDSRRPLVADTLR